MKKILISVAAAVLVLMIAWNFMDKEKSLSLFAVALMVSLWTTEAIPIGAVSLLPLLLYPSLGIMSLKQTSLNYSEPVIFLFLGGFMMAIAVEKTNLHKYLAIRLLRIFPATPTGLVYGVIITSGLISSVLSNTTVTLMLLPIVMMLTDNTKVKVKLLLALAFGSSIGGLLTPVGTPPNMILLGFMQKFDLGSISFVKWIYMMLPVVIPMLITAPWFLAFTVRKEKLEGKSFESGKADASQKKLMVYLTTVFLLLLLNSKIDPWYKGFGLDERAILLAAGLLLFLPGLSFLKWEDTREIPYEIIFLFGAGFAIADSFAKSHLVESFALSLENLSTLAPCIIFFVTAVIVSIATNLTSNTAVVSVALPIFLQLAQHVTFDKNIILLVVTVASSYAFILPIGTPPNAIVMSGGFLKTSQMIRGGFMVNALGIFFLVLAAYFFWL